MNKVIALWGISDTGKSDTLRKVHKVFLNIENLKTIDEYRITGTDSSDLREVMIINEILVGIETQGDPGYRLEESLKLFESIGCGVIICATRSRGATRAAVHSLEPKYQLSWRGQSHVSLKEYRDENNSSMAKLIVNEANAAIYA
ncbi:MAG: hypothetical protein WBM35_14990 [Candidatus Electrothrix sp.]